MRPEETVDYHVRYVWHAISRMYNQLGSEHDISTSLGFVLLNIRSEGGSQATKIAPLMGLEARSLTRLLKSMEEKGLIYRRRDDVDRRSVHIFLTPEGLRKKRIAQDTIKRFNEEIRKEIPQKELDTFFKVMTKMNQFITDTKSLEQITS